MMDGDVIILSLTIIVTVGQVVTLVVLVCLYKAFLDLKWREKYNESQPTIEISMEPARLPSVGTTQRPEYNEHITRLPTPSPDRRASNRPKLPDPSPVVNPPIENTNRGLSITSWTALSRDSGIFDPARDHGSLSSKKSRDSRGSSVFTEGLQEERDANNASRGSRPESRLRASSSRDQANPVTAIKRPMNEEIQAGRLQTMDIGLIDVTRSDEKPYKRASKILNKTVEQLEELEVTTGEISFVNDGYRGDDRTRAPLASEESSCGFSCEVERVNEDSNDALEEDQDEVYVNQEIVDQERKKNFLEVIHPYP